MARGTWVYVGGRAGVKPPLAEKEAITAACEKLIAEVLKPRFLPEVQATSFNYPVEIRGKWHGNKYRFVTRYRSDDPSATQPEFDAPFARLEYVSRDRFDLSWHRHTAEWHRLYTYLPLHDCLRLIESEPHFRPG